MIAYDSSFHIMPQAIWNLCHLIVYDSQKANGKMTEAGQTWRQLFPEFKKQKLLN